MKKPFTLLVGVFLIFGLVISANADPYVWIDEIDFNPDLYIGWFASEDYIHDISDGADGFNGFSMGGDDYLTGYSLTVAMYDDGGRWDSGEIAYINQPGILGDGYYNFSYVNNTFGWSLAGLISLNIDGKLNVSVDSYWGDFYIASSTLNAWGDNGSSAAPVPEPTTILLSGLGLLGMGAYIRRKRSKR